MSEVLKYIEEPNLPQSKVKLVLIDGRISPEIEASLSNMNIDFIKTERHPGLYAAMAFHPDAFIHHVFKDQIIYAPGTPPVLLDKLSKRGFKLFMGEAFLKREYPMNIAYNAARVGKFFIHNLKYTDSILMKALLEQGLKAINVKQGYAKCSVSVVDENSIITADTGIAKAAENKGLDVLLLPPKQGIELPGLDYGFIGGSSGLLNKDLWSVSGDATKLSSFSEIQKFLTKKNIKIISLSQKSSVDLGSILPLMTI